MFRKILPSLTLLCVLTIDGFSQMKIGANPTTINGGSVLELESTTQGLLFPRIALTATGTWGLAGVSTEGMVVYNTTVGITGTGANGAGLYFWDATLARWVYLQTANNNWTTTGNSGTVAGTNFIGTIDAVDWMIKTTNIERMRVKSTGNIVIGADDGTTSPTPDTLRGPNRTGTDKNGQHLTFAPGNGTGTGGSGAIVFVTAPVDAASSSTANTLKERGRFTNDGSLNVNTVANVFSDDLITSQGSNKFLYPVNGYATVAGADAIYGSSIGTGFNASTGYGTYAVLGIHGNGATGLINGTFGALITNAGGGFQGLTYGVFGQSDPVNATTTGVAGVLGYGSTSAANGAYGVYGTYDLEDNLNYGIGVLGVGDGGAAPVLNADYGVLGSVGTTLTAEAGVAGYAGTVAAPIANAGVYGSGELSTGYGVFGINTSTGTGVMGIGDNNTTFTVYTGAGGSFYSSSVGAFGTYDATNFYGAALYGAGEGGSTTLPATSSLGVVGTIGNTFSTAGETGAGIAGYTGAISTPLLTSTNSVGVYGSSSSTSRFAIYSNGALAVTLGNIASSVVTTVTNAALSIKNGHLQSQQTTAPTLTARVTTVVGTTGTLTITNGTDIAGKLSIATSGTAPSAAGQVIQVVFNKSYAVAPIVVITPTNANATTRLFYITSTTANFTITNTATLANGTTYTFNYHVIETQ